MCGGRGSRRWRQLRRTGRRLPRRSVAEGVRPDPRRRSVQEYVELPGPAARGDRQHRGAAQHGGQADVRRPPFDYDRDCQQQDRSDASAGGWAVFSFIGAVPRTDWLPKKEIEIDSKGFVRTGPALAQSPTWGAKRPPFLLNEPAGGAGDVRSGSVICVASAVGEGAMAVQFVHEYLKEGTATQISSKPPPAGKTLFPGNPPWLASRVEESPLSDRDSSHHMELSR